MKLCIVIRGDIGNKIYQVWENNLKKKFGVTVSSTCEVDCDAVVYGKTCTKESLEIWSKGTKFISKVPVVVPDWVVSSLKSGILLPYDNFNHPAISHIDHGLTLLPVESNNNELSSMENTSDLKNNLYSSRKIGMKSNTTNNQSSTTTATTTAAAIQYIPSPSHDADASNQNKHITDILDELQAIYLQLGDQFRAQNYKKSSGVLKRMKYISNSNQLDGITGFGKSLKTTIQEILTTKDLRKLQHLKNNPRSSAITHLSNIWGIGEKTAENLYNQGYHNIQDIREKGKYLLNRQQLVGLQYYEEFLLRIPRDEVEEISQIVEDEMKRIDPEVDCTTCGSYRRGKADCGDVDILITPSDSALTDSLPANTLSRLLLALERRGFLTDHLSLPSGHQEYVANSALEQQLYYRAAGSSTYAKSASGHSHRSSVQKSSRSAHGSKAAVVSQPQTMIQSPLAGKVCCEVDSPSPRQPPSALSPVGQSGCHVSSTALAVSELPLSQSDGDYQGEPSDWTNSNSEEDYSEGYGTQSDGEGGDKSVKYDTYGGKKKKSAHRLYFGSRGSYMGVCKVPGEGAIHRRIDIKVYPRTQRAFALFYFTGSDSFNRGVRFYASKYGFALDDKGLMHCVRDDKHKIVSRGALVPCATEAEIFDQLGLQYREPWDRAMFDPKTMVVRSLGAAKIGWRILPQKRDSEMTIDLVQTGKEKSGACSEEERASPQQELGLVHNSRLLVWSSDSDKSPTVKKRQRT